MLSIEDLSRDLYAAGVREVRYFSGYRPTKAAMAGGSSKGHGAGMAIDIKSFTLNEGTTYDVDRDFDGKLGDPPCTWSTPFRAHGAWVLHDIACRAHSRGLFHVMLTPNANREHKNHFHFEIREATGWFYLR
jgi:hypothetical protein